MQLFPSAPLISIVTPVFNGEKYLEECIESVLAQTYQNWEYVIADNASTDGSRKIAQHYAARDRRIRACAFDEHLRLVKNHNRAFGLISEHSVYCKPLMADDWLFPECLERMLRAMQYDSSIGLVCSLAFDGRFVMWDGFPYPAQHVPGREAARAALRGLGSVYFLGSPTSMLLRSADVRRRRPFYNESNVNQMVDVEAALELLLEADFAFIHQVLSLNRVHPDSQSSRVAAKFGDIPGNDAYLVARFGHAVFDEQEFGCQRRRTLRTYYRSLARAFFTRRELDFWRRHRLLFRQMSERFSIAAFCRALAIESGRAVLRPLQTLKAVRRRWQPG